MKTFFVWSRWWPVLLLTLLVSVLLFSNYRSGAFLAGWDNLQMELGPEINLERAWQAAWEEYQGVGLEGGMAHSADLFRQLFFWPLNYLLPLSLVRFTWHALMILTGVLSTYALLRQLLLSQQMSRLGKKLAALGGASFYLLNFASVQNFYTTFEPFAAFFAFLPLLLFVLLKIFSVTQVEQKKWLLIFALVSILATSIAYVQTVFVVYAMVVLTLLLFFALRNLLSLKQPFWLAVKLPFLLGLMIFVINAFWFLPAAHFMLSDNASTLQFSKGKEMSNDILYFKNKAFGNFSSLAKLQGFWLEETDFDLSGNMIWLMDEWKIHWGQLSTELLAWLFFALLGLGLFKVFRERHELRWLLVAVFLLSVTVLGNDLFPFSYLVLFLQAILPFFYEMFRIAFTKWVVPFSLFYSIFLTFGLAFVFDFFSKKISQFFLSNLFLLALLFYAWPAFQGHYFYKRLQVQIPEPYFQLFSYFKNLPESSRIANLPQHSFYGWQWNDWGYHGSGFLWYGIKQPILDRAFDVWSTAQERYYWQLQTALDKKDVKMLENVMGQYDVDYVLLDESILNRNTVKPLNYEAIKELLAGSKRLKLIQEFDFISLYEFADEENQREKDFVSLYENLPIINNQHQFSWSDQSYANFHDYLSEPNNLANQAKIIYPFSSLFTNKLQKNFEFSLSETNDYFYLESLKELSGSTQDFALELPNLLKTETQLPFRLSWTTDSGATKLIFKALLPEIYWQDQKFYYDFAKEFTLKSDLCLTAKECFININNELTQPFQSSGQVDLLLSSKIINTVALSTANKTEYFDYTLFDLAFHDLPAKQLLLKENNDFLVKIPKVFVQADLVKSELNSFESDSCRPLSQGSALKDFRDSSNYYAATGTSICDRFYLGQLRHQNSYLFRLDAKNLSSMPLVFTVQAESLGRSPLETYLSEGVNYQIVPPTEQFNAGYTLYLSSDSFGRESNEDLLKSAEVFAWPYNFLKNLYLQDVNWNFAKANLATCDFQVNKKALWLYEVLVPAGCQASYLKLSQAYDRAWLAWQDGQWLKHHKLNNWANAWALSESSQEQKIYIFFYPQLLEYLGLALLLCLPCFFGKKMR